MHPIIYDVAVSMDGFICGPGGDVSKFAHDGPVVDDYKARLEGYKTAIMGRSTYEFGYQFGLEPGRNPYPHMETIVFSRMLDCPPDSEISIKRVADEEEIRNLKKSAKAPIYLCGGGTFAGWLLVRGLIDRIILKRSPTVYGRGVKLFGETGFDRGYATVSTKNYESGYILEEYSLDAKNMA